MRIFITGVSCVGKTSIGAILATRLDYRFYDLDKEIERFFNTTIERLRNRHLTSESFRHEAAKVLMHIIKTSESHNFVMALPPSGMMGRYLKVLKETEGIMVVVLADTPENILNRITFYDIDSRPIEKQLTEKEKRFYLREIKRDISYYHKSYDRAHLRIDIEGLSAAEGAEKMHQLLESFLTEETTPSSTHKTSTSL